MGDDPRASKEEKNAFFSIDVRLLMKLLFYPQYHLFHKEDCEETVCTRSSEESADEDSTPKESKTQMWVIGLKDGILHRYVSPLTAFNNKVTMHRNHTENDNGVTALFFPIFVFPHGRKKERRKKLI